MNKNSSICIRVTVFLLLLAIFIGAGSYLFTPKSGSKNYRASYIAAEGIDKEPDNTIDVLIVGDSETYSGLSPLSMWQEDGFTSFVCATSGQYLFESYNYVESTLKKQKPKVVILETNNIYRRYNLDNYIGAKVEQVLPIAKYHNRWKTVNLHDLSGSVADATEKSFKGYVPYNMREPVKKVTESKKTGACKVIPDLNQRTLKELIWLCKDNNIKILFVSSPSIKNWTYQKHNGIAAFAKKNNVSFLDMNLINDQVGIDWKNDTRDKGDHLNIDGAIKASHYLARYLDEQYSLPDHRKDESYTEWEKSLNKYTKEISRLRDCYKTE